MQDATTPPAALPAPAAPVPDVQISLRLSAALLEQIDAAARELGLNRAGFVRMSLKTALRNQPKGD